jgi:hypothetical protein
MSDVPQTIIDGKDNEADHEGCEMSSSKSATEHLAYRLWESRGRPIGDAERDWFEAQRLVHDVAVEYAHSTPEFYHCFTRKGGSEEALRTLRLMLDIGILLTPERIEFGDERCFTQVRLSLGLLRDHELCSHADKFGCFALRLAPYLDVAAKLGAMPVWYFHQFFRKLGHGDGFRHGAELIRLLREAQRWIHSKQNDNERHESFAFTQAAARLMYPTQFTDTAIEETYFLQREWRVIRWGNTSLGRVTELSDSDREKLLSHNPELFSKRKFPVWSDEKHQMTEVTMIETTYKLSLPLQDVVKEILVPPSLVMDVNAMNPGVPVRSWHEFRYGWRP